MTRIVALMDDLFFQMKLAETAKHLGLEVKVAADGDRLFELLDPAPGLIIVDLHARNEPLAVIARLRHARPAIPIISFASHVERELIDRARAAGSEDVMPRSAFTRNLADILGRAKG